MESNTDGENRSASANASNNTSASDAAAAEDDYENDAAPPVSSVRPSIVVNPRNLMDRYEDDEFEVNDVY